MRVPWSTERRRWPARPGLALVAVMWVLLLLSVMGASFLQESRGEVRLALNLMQEAQAEALADAAVAIGLQWLSEPRITTRPLADGSLVPIAFAGGTVVLSIQDEGGRIDLNAASVELLRGLFLSRGTGNDLADELADRIQDFRDTDNLRRLHGAEDGDYAAAGLPHGAKDAPFELVEELSQVLGMTDRVFTQVAPFVTVYSARSTVNPRTAPAGVLLALPGVDKRQIEAYVAARTGAGEGTVLPRLAGPGAQFLAAAPTQTYNLKAEVTTTSGHRFLRDAVVRLTPDIDLREPNPFRTLIWSRGTLAAPAE